MLTTSFRPLALWSMAACFSVAVSLTASTHAQAQEKKKNNPIPKPRKVDLATKDGVELSGVYFGSNKGKEAIPVLIIHEWRGQKAPYGSLCMMLQRAGCAVLAFDYRGHGGSREYTDPRTGTKKEFKIETMRRKSVNEIARFDLETAKQFFKDENNEENLNLNALVIIGIREGCVIGTNWAMVDWRYPSVGSRKQGQDVKALVMVSPKRLAQGVPIDQALSDRNIGQLPTMVIYGQGSNEEDDAKRIQKLLEANKRRLSGSREAEGLEVMEVSEPLGGPALISGQSSVIPAIVKFITEQVKISDNENPWIERD
ncbi:alpha/beta hydrolase [Roseiconus lacunae]|uniref:Alpha/beta hydrolase n=1 Tax=Roseiconus lacunae TaxID=2605694 RepID=A0ABT7PDA2_9BACT|nr:alpha/beta hydrolase [Roseiconus lacunae]MCD0459765.1 alpha/beta hydrolase [Roseiconus lacunae]MDM4014462.1 alpha/beta hydrolase [Roseiconus lacunae]WRQ49777.1 alpha/beta hydrolase [Stieleria sp. HD01]